jgi:hypothetical protein
MGGDVDLVIDLKFGIIWGASIIEIAFKEEIMKRSWIWFIFMFIDNEAGIIFIWIDFEAIFTDGERFEIIGGVDKFANHFILVFTDEVRCDFGHLIIAEGTFHENRANFRSLFLMLSKLLDEIGIIWFTEQINFPVAFP